MGMLKPNHLHLLSALAVAACLNTVPSTAEAQVYRCKGPDGRVSLGDRPCPEGVSGEALKGLPGVPVPPAKSSEPALEPQLSNSSECERLRERTRYDRSTGSRSAASIRNAVDRYQQECLGYTRTAGKSKDRDAELRREFADQGCEIKRRAVRDGHDKLATMSSSDRRAHNAMAAEVARDC